MTLSAGCRGSLPMSDLGTLLTLGRILADRATQRPQRSPNLVYLMRRRELRLRAIARGWLLPTCASLCAGGLPDTRAAQKRKDSAGCPNTGDQAVPAGESGWRHMCPYQPAGHARPKGRLGASLQNATYDCLPSPIMRDPNLLAFLPASNDLACPPLLRGMERADAVACLTEPGEEARCLHRATEERASLSPQAPACERDALTCAYLPHRERPKKC